MRDARRQQVVAGLVLIVLGVGLYALQWFGELGRAAILFLVGGTFLAGYFYQRHYGFLIPGCILVGLASGMVGGDSIFRFGNSTLLGLGSGFIAIFVIALLYERRSHWWPWIPGVILILVGLPDTKEIVEFLFENWPLILVAIGILMLLGALGRPRRRRGDLEAGD